MVSDILLNLNYPFFIPNNFEHNLGRSSSLSINVKNQTVSSNNSEMIKAKRKATLTLKLPEKRFELIREYIRVMTDFFMASLIGTNF